MKYIFIFIGLFIIQSVNGIETVSKDSSKIKLGQVIVDSTKVAPSFNNDTSVTNDTLSVKDTLIIDTTKAEILPYKVTKTNIYNLGANEDECDVVAICDEKEHFAIRVKKRDTYAIHYPTFKKKFFRYVGFATISPDCQDVAYGVLTKGKSYLYVNNQRINKDFDPWILPKYNQDGSHLLYFKENWNTLSSKPRRIIVVDSTEYKFDKLLGSIPVTWSPNKKHWASLVKKGRKSFLVINGGRGPSYQDCKIGPIFTDDSKKVAYTAYRNDTCYLVIATEKNGMYGGEFSGKKSKNYYKQTNDVSVGSFYQELGGYRNIYGFMFFDSSYEFLMQTVMNYDHFVETVDTTYGPYDTTFSFEFNDGNQCSFTAKKGNKFFIKTFDDKEKIIDAQYTRRAISITDLGYSDDNLHLSYVIVNRDESEHLFLDDSLICSSNIHQYYGEFYPITSDFYFYSREYKKVDNEIENVSWSFISPTQDTIKYEYMSEPLFSSDGSIVVHLGYMYDDDEKFSKADLIINGKVFQRYTDFIGFDEFDESDNLTLFMTEKKKRVYKLVISPNKPNAE